MMFDYPEMNPFADFSGGAYGQMESVVAVIEENGKDLFPSFVSHASSDDKEQFPAKSLSAVVTDPPYFDAIAYADLSDFFYVWLRRTLGDVYPASFAAPQTPRADECTALRHQHAGDAAKAAHHFGNKLLQILNAIERQTSGVVSIMFAHQSTEAWATLCDSILGARMNVMGSWAINTEMAVRMVSLGNAALQSSVTVSCKPARREGLGEYGRVREAVGRKVGEEVAGLYALGFRGADLLTACFGKAVSEFGRYERVLKASGEEVTVAELLEMTRESAFSALLKGFEGDDYTKFYIGWLELYGFDEGDFDAAAKLARAGHSINAADLFARGLLVRDGGRLSLAGRAQRAAALKLPGEDGDSPLVDQAHRAMSLQERGDRRALLDLIGRVAASPNAPFWRVLTSLDELLPKGTHERKLAAGLLENKESLIRECRAARAAAAE
jgi:adenine-specific DNA methylase